MELIFFEQLLAILGTSLVATVVLQRFGLPNIIAYLLAGVLIGPHAIAWVDQPDRFSFLAEFGVVFLLFSLGLEFSLLKLIELRSSVFGVGTTQVLICSVVFGGAVWLWGVSFEGAVIIAGALALSSTAIVSKELSELRQVHSRHGQLSVGVLLFQDFAAVLFLILVPVLAGNDEQSLWSAVAWALGKGVVLVVVLLSAGKWLLPVLHREVALAKSEEVFVLSTLVIVLLASWITHSFHLSMALGAFVIGMMLGESPFRHQINSDIRAFKDILLGLFFVTIGMSVELQLLQQYWLRILLFAAGLIVIKVVLIGVLVKMLGNSTDIALKSGLNLAQAGEFGLALLALGVMHGLLPGDQSSFIILVAIFSMALSPFLIRHSEALCGYWHRWFGAQAEPSTTTDELAVPQQGHVIIGGFGRVGKTVARLLEANGIDYVAIDQDINLVNQGLSGHHNVLYGDCTKMDILHSCHISSAKMAILTLSSMDVAKDTIEHIRGAGITVPIIVRCYEHGDFAELIALGANSVVPEMLEASLVIGAQVLSEFEINEHIIEQQIDLERSEWLGQTNEPV